MFGSFLHRIDDFKNGSKICIICVVDKHTSVENLVEIDEVGNSPALNMYRPETKQ